MALRAAVLAVIGIALLLYVVNARAEPVLEASEDGVRVVLHTDKCALKEVSNMPYRVVWHEKGKQIEGCWMPRPDAGIVVMFFAADRTVGVAAIQSFRRVTSI